MRAPRLHTVAGRPARGLLKEETALVSGLRSEWKSESASELVSAKKTERGRVTESESASELVSAKRTETGRVTEVVPGKDLAR